jgi:hypothetical protein
VCLARHTQYPSNAHRYKKWGKRGKKEAKEKKQAGKKQKRHLIEERIVLWRKCVKLCASENA